MSWDLTPILRAWPYEPDDLQVRIVAGDDGTERLQMRLDLGLLQMELSGRPDGVRPRGAESWLDHFERALRERGKAEPPFALDEDACGELHREGLQYYHRYLALFHLRRFDLVVRDTERNLRLLAFVVAHAERPDLRLRFDQYRPYITMMRARALGLAAIDRGEDAEALAAIDRGIAGIRDFLREYGQDDREADCRELGLLLDWRAEVERQRRLGPIERLEQQLQLAVAFEQFEEAARLRDRIRELRAPSTST